MHMKQSLNMQANKLSSSSRAALGTIWGLMSVISDSVHSHDTILHTQVDLSSHIIKLHL